MKIEDWNNELGLAQCIITDKSNGITFKGYGKAQCHDEDEDFKSHMTGMYIATCRAQIDILRQKRDYDMKPGLMALKHLQSTMINSKLYNPTSYESQRLTSEIMNMEKEIEYLNSNIQDLKEGLKIYLEHKEALYQNLRKGQN